jgi:hypothetical protein
LIHDKVYIYMYRCDEKLLEFLVVNDVNRGAGQTRKAFAKKTVLIGFPNIPDIRLTGTRQKKCRRQGWWFLGGGGGVQRVHLQPGIILMLIII